LALAAAARLAMWEGAGVRVGARAQPPGGCSLRRVGAALALLVLGCGAGRAEPWTAPQRLLEHPGAVTLGDETRLASADKPRLVLRRALAAGRRLPRLAPVPWRGARGQRVLLSARAWRGQGPGTRARAAAGEVDTFSAVARLLPRGVSLAGLAAGAPEPPFTVQVMALPLPTSPVRVEAAVDVPAGAVLAFGYALREESWQASTTPVHFRVRARDGAGGEQLLFEASLDPSDAAMRRWHDARVDLSALAGSRVDFELEASWEGGADSFALPVFADPTVYVPGAGPHPPNVLLVSLDTLRARSLGSFGYARDTSPFIDALARQGSLFGSTMTTSATTGPSHMSLFTGLYPVHHGLVTGAEWKRPEVPTLASLLRAAGYTTAAFTEDGFLVRPKGFGEGFSHYVENRKLPERPRDVRITFGQARRWLEQNEQQPFFVFVHTYEVHVPYAPPERYAQVFAGDGLPGPERADIRQMRDAYDREIRYVDDELRSLFAALRELGLDESTLVVITADHGEEFAEHGWLQHGSTVFQEVIHVPLLFWAPGLVPQGREIERPVSLIDVAPTILSLVGVPAPVALDGVDLSGLMDGSATLAPRRLFAEARSKLRQTGPNMMVGREPPLVAVRSESEKFIVHRPAHGTPEPSQAYDLAADPDEQQPRLLEGAEKREIEALVDRYLAGATGSAAAPGDGSGQGFDPETEAQLRDLGYLD
jgi:arylsulfatase A-like enzyme